MIIDHAFRLWLRPVLPVPGKTKGEVSRQPCRAVRTMTQGLWARAGRSAACRSGHADAPDRAG